MLALTLTHDFRAGTLAQVHREPPHRPHVTSTSRHDSDAVVVGVDYGTLSGRAVVVRVRDGQELGGAVAEYPHGY